MLEDPEALRRVTDLCQACWKRKSVPDDWHEARVVAIFKKGEVADPTIYRPIPLLAIAYTMFAGILLRRLKAGGAEGRVRATQFGFKSVLARVTLCSSRAACLTELGPNWTYAC